MGVLTGFAVPITWLGADHTYVKSDNNDSWGCWGRDSGGTAVCSGSGSIPRSRCLSQPFGVAGIIYGLTGVCHQTANRILYPSGGTVSQARGYWASSFVYGAYGTDTAVWLAHIVLCGVTAPAATKNVAAKKSTAQLSKKAASPKMFATRVIALHQAGLAKSGAPNLASLADEETKLLLAHLAPKALTATTRDSVLSLRQKNDKQLRALVDKVHAGKIDGRKFAEDGNALISDLFRKSARALGPEQYTDMFGYAHDEEVKLIDPEIAAASFTSP